MCCKPPQCLTAFLDIASKNIFLWKYASKFPCYFPVILISQVILTPYSIFQMPCSCIYVKRNQSCSLEVVFPRFRCLQILNTSHVRNCPPEHHRAIIPLLADKNKHLLSVFHCHKIYCFLLWVHCSKREHLLKMSQP